MTTVPADPSYGAGSKVKDPGFNSAGLKDWNATGGAAVERTAQGLLVAKLGQSSSAISQTLESLDPGSYSIGAWVEIEPGKKRPTTLTVTPAGSTPVSVTVDQSDAENFVAADEKRGTYFQRLRVLVDIANAGAPQLSISAPSGEAAVRIDDVRVVKASKVPSTGILSENFENTDQGWWPLIKGDAGGQTDPRTHIAKLNAPYTQKGWNGKTTSDVLDDTYSLHSHEENQGLIYRTSNYTLPLQAGRQYRVSFDYQASLANQYAWVSGYDSGKDPVQTASTAIPIATDTTRWSQTFSAGSCGPAWVGLQRTGSSDGAEFSMDNLLVEDLGPSAETPACASLSLISGQDVIEQGQTNTFSTSFSSSEAQSIAGLSVALDLPAGWTASAATPATAATLPAGGSLETQWKVHVPADADGDYTIKAKANYRTTVDPIGSRSATTETAVYTLPKPPTKDTYASNLQWIGTPSNGWGPVEKDQANGEQAQGDGPPLTLGGVTYPKGLGAHAASSIRYYVGSQCSAFTAVIGIDDFQKLKGQAVFSVLGDGNSLYTSPVMKGGAAAQTITVPLNGTKYVDLKVAISGANNGNAWSDWANAKFLCSAPVAPITLQPTLSVPTDSLQPGSAFTVRVDQLKPASTAKAELHSDPIDLGSVQANNDGVASFQVTLAQDAPLGNHQIVVTGTDKNGLAATGTVDVQIKAANPNPGTGSNPGTDPGTGSAGGNSSGSGTNGSGATGTGVNGSSTNGSGGNLGNGAGIDDNAGSNSASSLAETGFSGLVLPLGIGLLLLLVGAAAIIVRRHRHS